MRIDLDKYDLISLDIFDTLLLRALAKPIDLFLIVWEQAIKEDINLTDISPMEFMKLRVEMERRARNKAIKREVNLNEIYNEIPNYIVNNIEQLKQLEIEAEKEYCYQNFDIYDLAKESKNAGKKIILLSDMYLSSRQITDILEHNGIDVSIFDAIIMSNERKCSKQNGELYQELLQQYPDIAKEKILHIGDNKNSDYIQALKVGIHALHYDVIPDKLKSIYDYEKIRHNIPQKSLLSLRKIVAESVEYQNEEEKIAYELGASIVGPFLTMYISWVCDRMHKLKIERIYPFMREGFLLGELLKKEAENREKELLIKPIYISRKVTYVPSIVKVDREEIENMIGARNLTVKESILLMGLDTIDFSDISEYMDIKLKKSHQILYSERETLKEHIIELFLEEDKRVKIENHIENQRALLNNYLKQEIGDFHNIATIDIGFFGRIQLWMEKSLDLDNIPHEMKHFLAIGVTGDKLYDGMNFEGYYGTMAENADLFTTIHRTTDILEKLISVTEGSTIGYEIKSDKIVPIKSAEVKNKKFKDIVFQGIFDFQQYWFKFEKAKPELAAKCVMNRRETLMILHRLIDMPRLVEAKVLGRIESDTNFGTNYKKSIITNENILILEKKGVDYIDKCNISYTYDNSNIVWPKGLVTLKDEFYYVRRALKNNSSNEIMKAMQEVVEQVEEQGIKEIALYGAGENGRQFYFMCNLYHIRVNCFIDRKESIWGTMKEGIEVIGLKEAIERGNEAFIVTSLFSISEIKDYIIKNFEIIGQKSNIFHV